MSVVSAYSSYEFIRVTSPAPGVAHVEINRPKKLNAFSRPVWLEFGRVFKQISEDSDFNAVVLTGAGDRAFTSGLDVQAAATDSPFLGKEDLDTARVGKILREHIQEFQEAVSSVEKCEKPVIGVLHGISFGLAMDLASCMDIRIASADVRLSVKEVDIGIPADIGTLARLPKIVGSTSWVKDVCLTARTFDAKEALAVGLVSQVHDNKAKAVQAALDLATSLASKSPTAVQGTKELINHGLQHTTDESLRYTQVWNSLAVQSEDFRKAMTSGLTKTKPTFSKL